MDLTVSLWPLLFMMLLAVVLLAVLLLVLALWMLLVGGSTAPLSRSASAVIVGRLGDSLAVVEPRDQDRLRRLGEAKTAEGWSDRSDLVDAARQVESLAPEPAPRSTPRVLEVSSTLRYREQLLEEATERLQRRCSLVTATTAIRRARLYVVHEQARVLIDGFHCLGPLLARCWIAVAARSISNFGATGVVVAMALGIVVQILTRGSWTVDPIAHIGIAGTWGMLFGAVVVSARTILSIFQHRLGDGGAPHPTRDGLVLRFTLLLACLVLALLATGTFDRFYRWQAAWVSSWGTGGLDGVPEVVQNVVLGTVMAALVCLLVWCLVVAPLRQVWRHRGRLRFWTGARVSTGILGSTYLLLWTTMALLSGFFLAMGAAVALEVAVPPTVVVWALLVPALAPFAVLAVGLTSAGVARFAERRRERRALAAMGLRRERITPPWALVSAYAAGWLVVGMGSLLVFVASVDGVVDDRTYPLLCAVVMVPAGTAALAAFVHSRINSRRISDENVRLHRLIAHRAETGADVS